MQLIDADVGIVTEAYSDTWSSQFHLSTLLARMLGLSRPLD